MQFHFMRHFSCFLLFTCFQLSPPSFPHFSGRTKATCWIHNLSTLVFTCLYIRFFKLYRELFDCFHFSSPSTATTKYKAILRKCFIPPPLVSRNPFSIFLLFMHFTYSIMHDQLCAIPFCKNSKKPCIFAFRFSWFAVCVSKSNSKNTTNTYFCI